MGDGIFLDPWNPYTGNISYNPYVKDAIVKLKTSVLRYPGGVYCEYYNWQAGSLFLNPCFQEWETTNQEDTVSQTQTNKFF